MPDPADAATTTTATGQEANPTMTTTPQQQPLATETQRQLEESLANVREALSGLKYGNVLLTIHEGRVVQIDVTEKKRLNPN